MDECGAVVEWLTGRHRRTRRKTCCSVTYHESHLKSPGIGSRSPRRKAPWAMVRLQMRMVCYIDWEWINYKIKNTAKHTPVHKLSPIIRFLVDKLVVTHLVTKFPVFYKDPKFILQYSKETFIGPFSEPDESTCSLTLYLFKVYFNIILPSTPHPPKWYLSLGLPINILYLCVSYLVHACSTSRPCHHSWFDYPVLFVELISRILSFLMERK
jgi:hypothetical protein